MDSNVRRIYEGDPDKVAPSFTDEELVNAIRTFKSHGFNVYLTLAYQPMGGVPHPIGRKFIGDPLAPQEDRSIDPRFWPWSLNHPEHDSFVADFWKSYTEQAVQYRPIG